MLKQTQKLKVIFTKTQNDTIDSIIEDIKKAGDNYKTIELWKFDQSLGGIGGYCQGCDPANSNPFQGSIYRNVYRCFQYVRADIDILDLNYTARDIIENCGHHFEESIKIYLHDYKKLEFFKVRKYPLGKLLNYISDKNIFEKNLSEELKLFVDLYNISKHEILSNDELDRTFHLDDAIICYFASRIVGKKILMLIDNNTAQGTYEINWNKYGKNINRFKKKNWSKKRMIYITGDTHADFSKFEEDKFPIQSSEMTKNDYIIICGDFGGVWNYIVESIYEKHWLDWLNNKNFTTLFVDGNHENFERLYNYPVEEWHGGKVHKIRESVIHLMRGEIFNIDNKKFFAFGGARSHDIRDGILNIDEYEKIYEYRKRGAYFRIRDYSWWDLELPSDEEMKNGIKNLEKVNYKVDYIISHCCPTSIQTLLNPSYKKDILTDYLQKISEKCEFKKWYFGHYHDYRQINSQFTLLYENIVPLEFNSIFK